MEPNYLNLDPEERNNKFLAYVSVALGVLSLCAGIIPIVGIVISLLGLLSGYFGTRSDNRKIAKIGILVCCLGLLISFVYATILMINRLQNPAA